LFEFFLRILKETHLFWR